MGMVLNTGYTKCLYGRGTALFKNVQVKDEMPIIAVERISM
jgi:hypothetical protein